MATIGTYQFLVKAHGCLALAVSSANAIDRCYARHLALTIGNMIAHTDTACAPLVITRQFVEAIWA